ncbi:hypothetical protein AM1_D0261 (plasmid) [Acaryochloris marina MBIC11017]|uniref:Uncharacterized protein n=1 Tax=Acaryochloris marina (strain MBIC 11017) TaxID=329726 RepID=A8ZP16_ACAM1|nr:hypothetical protein AM1_D0261 [Acaryochloris marina MBIC11017]
MGVFAEKEQILGQNPSPTYGLRRWPVQSQKNAGGVPSYPWTKQS